MSDERSSQVTTVVAAFAVGTLVGAALAMLYAPASGRETRELLSRKTRELKEKVDESISEAKEMINEKKEELIAAVKAGKKAMCEKAGESENV